MSDLAATNCGCECGNGDNGCGSLIWILLLLCCCGGNNGSFLSNGSGCDNILPLLLILCCCGNGTLESICTSCYLPLILAAVYCVIKKGGLCNMFGSCCK